MHSISHVIQARITITQDTHKCQRCRHVGNIAYTSYEVATEAQRDEVVRIVKGGTSYKKAVKETFPVHDRVYEDTLHEQQQGLPQEHRRDLDCFPCTAGFINSLMNIGHTHIGEILLSRLRPQGAIWIMRDITCPDRPGLIQTPHQDVQLLIQELREATTIRLMDK